MAMPTSADVAITVSSGCGRKVRAAGAAKACQPARSNSAEAMRTCSSGGSLAHSAGAARTSAIAPSRAASSQARRSAGSRAESHRPHTPCTRLIGPES
eukprot:3781086-Prymnesium_polylepis.2